MNTKGTKNYLSKSSTTSLSLSLLKKRVISTPQQFCYVTKNLKIHTVTFF